MNFKIFLSGSVPKGDNEKKQCVDWRSEYKKALSQLDEVRFVEDDTKKDETKPFLIFGHDANMIKSADLVIINADKKIGRGIGVGTAQEIMVAKYFSKPVITILPKNTHHRRTDIVFDGTLISDWISPFLQSTSDLVVENIHDALPWIKEYLEKPEGKIIKNISIIDDAIAAYLETNKNKKD